MSKNILRFLWWFKNKVITQTEVLYRKKSFFSHKYLLVFLYYAYSVYLCILHVYVHDLHISSSVTSLLSLLLEKLVKTVLESTLPHASHAFDFLYNLEEFITLVNESINAGLAPIKLLRGTDGATTHTLKIII